MSIKLNDHSPKVIDLYNNTINSLAATSKSIPDMLLYDEKGSLLYDAVCLSSEYYLTRTDLAIMQHNINDMAMRVGSNALLIEYGSGSSLKTDILLSGLPKIAGYVPIDISKEHLLKAAQRIQAKYPTLSIFPICADYNGAIPLPKEKLISQASKRLAYYPGSSIGHWKPAAAVEFLKRIKEVCGQNGQLLIGVDLEKEANILTNAYDNSSVKAFVMNILTHINWRFAGDFDLNTFRQEATYNHTYSRVEVYLVSLKEQAVRIGDQIISFYQGEKIKISHSYKYTLDSFADLAWQAGWEVEQVWKDARDMFSVQLLK